MGKAKHSFVSHNRFFVFPAKHISRFNDCKANEFAMEGDYLSLVELNQGIIVIIYTSQSSQAALNNG